eukprot:m.281661 g.281661  ORF g.281661 m.281661 type:complete len:694 (+) comp16336_c0_seq5:2267-4348(+)
MSPSGCRPLLQLLVANMSDTGDDVSTHKRGNKESNQRKRKKYKREQVGVDIDAEACTNLAFEEYYKAQKIVAEENWADLLQSLRTPLPMTVRVNTTRTSSDIIIKKLRADAACKEITWCPQHIAWRMSNQDYHSAKNEVIKSWIQGQNQGGGLWFQEEVSMLPPLLLDVKPEHYVLDMCSAPGSKTTEALELMHSLSPAKFPCGLLIANDIDTKRVNNIMTPRVRKLHTPAVAITVGNAAKFPQLNLEDESQLSFDRIMLDAPCSGDGTLRKEPSIWRNWDVHSAVDLHSQQLKLLMRGLTLLKDGGRLVYSTCSLNPIENEAVVLAAIRRFQGRVTLVPSKPEGVIAAEGLRTWSVPDPTVPKGKIPTLFSKFEDVPQVLKESNQKRRPILKSMFPTYEHADEEPWAINMIDSLKHCIRINPLHNDSGGFFCATLTKRLLRTDADYSDNVSRSSSANPSHKDVKIIKDALFTNGMSINILSKDDISNILDFYGIPLSKADVLHFLCMSDGKGNDRRITVASEGVLTLLKAFTRSRNALKHKQIQFTTLGVRVFRTYRQDFLKESPCRWRPCQEAVVLLGKICSRRRVLLEHDILLQLIEKQSLPLADLFDFQDNSRVSGMETICNGHVQGDKSPVQKIVLGGAVVGTLAGKESSLVDIWVSCVVTNHTLQTFVSKGELNGLMATLQAILQHD